VTGSGGGGPGGGGVRFSFAHALCVVEKLLEYGGNLPGGTSFLDSLCIVGDQRAASALNPVIVP
jgi:hypothetical protein